jgi:hypothetical protein
VQPAASIDFSSHIVSPEAVLAIAARCYNGAPAAYLLAIRGYEFAFLEEVTAAAADNLRAALAMLIERIGLTRRMAAS